jgi:hypothetical protein
MSVVNVMKRVQEKVSSKLVMMFIKKHMDTCLYSYQQSICMPVGMHDKSNDSALTILRNQQSVDPLTQYILILHSPQEHTIVIGVKEEE